MSKEPPQHTTQEQRHSRPLFHALRVTKVFDGEEHLRESVLQCRPWRMNLLAGSQDDPSVFFLAVNDQVHCYRCRHPKDPKPLLFRTLSTAEATGVPINAIIVGRIGGAELVVTVNDEGLVQCWFTALLDRHPLVFHNASSTWGISTHDATRLLAVSANSHRITIFNLQFAQHDSAGVTFCSSPGEESPLTEEKRVLVGHDNNIPDIDFSPCGWYLASCSIDGTCRIWKLDTGQVIWKETFGAWGWSVHFVSPFAFKHLPLSDISRIPLRKGYPAFRTGEKKPRTGWRYRLYRVGSLLQLFHRHVAETPNTDTDTESWADDIPSLDNDDSDDDGAVVEGVSLHEPTSAASETVSQFGGGGQESVLPEENAAPHADGLDEAAGSNDVEMTNEQQPLEPQVILSLAQLDNGVAPLQPGSNDGTDLRTGGSSTVPMSIETVSVPAHSQGNQFLASENTRVYGEEGEALDQICSVSTRESWDVSPVPAQFPFGSVGNEIRNRAENGESEYRPHHASSDDWLGNAGHISHEAADTLSTTPAVGSMSSASAEEQGGWRGRIVADNGLPITSTVDNTQGESDGVALSSSSYEIEDGSGAAPDANQGHLETPWSGEGWATQGPVPTFPFGDLSLPPGVGFSFDNAEEFDDFPDEEDLAYDADYAFSDDSDDSAGPIVPDVPDVPEGPSLEDDDQPATDTGGLPGNDGIIVGDPLSESNLVTASTPMEPDGNVLTAAAGSLDAEANEGLAANSQGTDIAGEGWGPPQGPVQVFSLGNLPPGMGLTFAVGGDPISDEDFPDDDISAPPDAITDFVTGTPPEADEDFASAHEQYEEKLISKEVSTGRCPSESVGDSWDLDDGSSSSSSEEPERDNAPCVLERMTPRDSSASEDTFLGEGPERSNSTGITDDGISRKHIFVFHTKALLPLEDFEDNDYSALATGDAVKGVGALPLVLFTTMRDLYLLRPAPVAPEISAHVESRKRPRPDEGLDARDTEVHGLATEDRQSDAPRARLETLVEITNVVARKDTRQLRRIMDFDRLNMVHWIPELSLALVGSQKGYIALVRLIRVYDDGSGNREDARHMRHCPSGEGKEGFILHVEGYLPLCDPPALPLLGWFVTAHQMPVSRSDSEMGNASTLSYHVVRMVYYNGVTMAYEIRRSPLANPASLGLAVV